MYIQSFLRRLEEEIHNTIPEELPFYKELKNYLFSSQGKRIRPLLCFLSAYSIDPTIGEKEEIFILCTVVELVHFASLLHDDVIDQAQKRRDLPSAPLLFGNKKTVLGGDYLLASALRRLTELSSIELIRFFTRVIQALATAEILQEEYLNSPSIDKEIYTKIIYGKTAILFEVACKSGAYLAGGEEKLLEEFSLLGREIGFYYQIRDDYLDYFYPSLLKKEPMQDFINGLYTYPLLLLKEEERAWKEIQEWISLPRKEKEKKEVQENVLSLLKKYHVQERIKKELHRRAQKIKKLFSKYFFHPESKKMQKAMEKIFIY